MKTKALFIVFIFACFTAYSQDWIEFTASESTKPNYELLESTDTIVEFEIDVPGMYTTVIDTFNRVQIKEHTRMDSVGYPEMPIISYLVAIPACDSVILNIELSDSIHYSNMNIYPAPELVPDTTAGGAIALIEQFSYYHEAYETDGWFPVTVVETIDKGAIRAQDVARVLFYPVQFNPVKKEIWAYSQAKITLTFYNSSGSLQKDVGIFNEVVGNALINYNSNGLNASVNCGAGLEESGTIKWVTTFPNDYVDDSCDYLIITNQNFYTDHVAKNEIEKLAQHRADFNGFNVCLTKMDDIVNSPFIIGDDAHEKMRNLIKNTYNDGNAYHTYDGKIAYVNLFGDAFFDDSTDCVPTYSEGYDVYFTQLTYDSIAGEYDPYPNLMIGRCSVDDYLQCRSVSYKIRNFTPRISPNKDRMLIATGHDPALYSSTNTALTQLDSFIPFDSIFLFSPNDYDSLYAYENFTLKKPYTLSNFLNIWKSGISLFYYDDHGSPDGINFYYEDIDSTSYNDILPMMVNMACLTGAFHNHDDCFCEKLLCNNTSRGAIAAIGANCITTASDIGPGFYNSLFHNSPVAGSCFIEA